MQYEPEFEPMNVNFVDKMGSDLTVVNAARVSFDKQHDEFRDNDEGLIRYLATHGHWTPFGHCQLQFRITAPVFVARQLVKHQIGLVWNEVSRRYVDTPPTYWKPTNWRAQDSNKKQGSKSNEFISVLSDSEGSRDIHNTYLQHVKASHNLYMNMIANGVGAEQARVVLPLSHNTQWYWTGSLMAFARVCNLRLDSHAQAEVREVAAMIDQQTREHFPVSWKYLVKNEQ